jgi:hypothetical protein
MKFDTGKTILLPGIKAGELFGGSSNLLLKVM